MELISREDLKEKLDRKDDFKLVMVLGDWQFRAMHIPGSLNISLPEIAHEMLDLNDEIATSDDSDSLPRTSLAWMV